MLSTTASSVVPGQMAEAPARLATQTSVLLTGNTSTKPPKTSLQSGASRQGLHGDYPGSQTCHPANGCMLCRVHACTSDASLRCRRAASTHSAGMYRRSLPCHGNEALPSSQLIAALAAL